MSCPTTVGGRSAAGFTLAEIMVALLVVVLGILAFSQFLGTISRAAGFSRQMTEATALAQEKTEELLREQYATLAGGSDTVGDYRRQWSISNQAVRTSILVTVDWDDIDGRSRQSVVRMMVSR